MKQSTNYSVRGHGWSYIFLFLFILLVLVLIKSAWVSEDAYITFRVVDNFINGYGLRWNVVERVQVYTNPMWLFLISGLYWLTSELYLTVIFTSLVVAMVAVWYPFKKLKVAHLSLLAPIVLLISSKSFVDYAVSGLENPLNCLILGLFFVSLFRTKELDLASFKWHVFLAAMAAFSRMDMILFFLPALLVQTWSLYFKQRVPLLRLVGQVLLCSLPLTLWVGFATVYYGFPFPNTYYSKLHTGITSSEYFIQGFLYFIDLVSHDPVTAFGISIGIVIGFKTKNQRIYLAIFGILLYMIYLLKIGGDFMTGRFFNVPVYLASLILVSVKLPKKAHIAIALFFAAVGLISFQPTLLYGEEMEYRENIRGIADERSYYHKVAGLINIFHRNEREPYSKQKLIIPEFLKKEGTKVVENGNIGYWGFHAGPEVFIIDFYGLGDAFLSKLPLSTNHGCDSWRVGHYRRKLPQGYKTSIMEGKNLLVDTSFSQLYDIIYSISRDPLFDRQRLKHILNFNLGQYKHLIKNPDDETIHLYNAYSLHTVAGQVKDYFMTDSSHCKVTESNDQNTPGNLVYGPFYSYREGKYKVTYTLKVDGETHDDFIANLVLFSYDNEGKNGVVVAKRVVHIRDFTENGVFEDFSLEFELQERVCMMEFHVGYLGNGKLTHLQTRVEKKDL